MTLMWLFMSRAVVGLTFMIALYCNTTILEETKAGYLLFLFSTDQLNKAMIKALMAR